MFFFRSFSKPNLPYFFPSQFIYIFCFVHFDTIKLTNGKSTASVCCCCLLLFFIRCWRACALSDKLSLFCRLSSSQRNARRTLSRFYTNTRRFLWLRSTPRCTPAGSQSKAARSRPGSDDGWCSKAQHCIISRHKRCATACATADGAWGASRRASERARRPGARSSGCARCKNRERKKKFFSRAESAGRCCVDGGAVCRLVCVCVARRLLFCCRISRSLARLTWSPTRSFARRPQKASRKNTCSVSAQRSESS